MITVESIIQSAPQLLVAGLALGFGVGASLVLLVEGLCSLFHTFFKIIGKE